MLGYLPQQLSEEEISEIVRQAVDEVGANSIKGMCKFTTISVCYRFGCEVVNQIVR